jgi:hypothetical protein
VFWFAVGVVFFLPLILGVPLVALAMLAWRMTIRVVGHARLAAYLLAASIVVAAAVLIPRTDAVEIALLVAQPTFAYATIGRG